MKIIIIIIFLACFFLHSYLKNTLKRVPENKQKRAARVNLVFLILLIIGKVTLMLLVLLSDYSLTVQEYTYGTVLIILLLKEATLLPDSVRDIELDKKQRRQVFCQKFITK